jgi:hypothetical protein
MLRSNIPPRASIAAFCWGVTALACTDLSPPDNLSAGVGGQSGDGSGIHGGQTGDGAGIAKIGVVQCPHKSTEWEGGLDEVVPQLDLAPAEVLATLETTIEDTLGWVANEQLGLVEATTNLVVDLHYTDGKIQLREPDSDGDPVRQEVADLAPPTSYVSMASQYCGTVLEIEVEAVLTTGDGALDEAFTLVVTANARGAAHFEGWLPKDLSGTLGDSTAHANQRLYVAGVLTPFGNSGEIVTIPIDKEPRPAQRIGAWPTIENHCSNHGYGTLVASSAPSGDTLRGMFESLTPDEIALTWTQTPPWPEACNMDTKESAECNTKLHIESSNVPDSWCVSVSPFDANFFANAKVAVDVSTNDAQWIGHYVSDVTLTSLEDQLSVGLQTYQEAVISSGEELGFANLQVQPNSDATLSWDLYAGQGASFGSLMVTGQRSTEQEPDAGAADVGAPGQLIGATLGP